MAGSQRAAWGARTLIGGVPLNHADWRAVARMVDLDTTNMETEGSETGILGVSVIEWDTGGDFDAGANQFDDPPGLFLRDDLESLQFLTNKDDNVGWFMNLARVISAENSAADIKGKVSFKASGKSNGPESSFPAGSV